MNTFKKVTIALTVACCLFFSTPMSTHAAAADTCRHAHLTLVDQSRFQGTETYSYVYLMDTDGDGEGELPVPDECRHAMFDLYSRYRCDDCGAYTSDWDFEYRYYTSHEEGHCPKIGKKDYFN